MVFSVSAHFPGMFLRGNVLLGNGLWCFGQICLWKENQQMFCIALVKPKRKFILLFCKGFSCRHCEGTRTCLQLLLDKEEVLFLWQEVSLACMPCLFVCVISESYSCQKSGKQWG